MLNYSFILATLANTTAAFAGSISIERDRLLIREQDFFKKATMPSAEQLQLTQSWRCSFFTTKMGKFDSKRVVVLNFEKITDERFRSALGSFSAVQFYQDEEQNAIVGTCPSTDKKCKVDLFIPS